MAQLRHPASQVETLPGNKNDCPKWQPVGRTRRLEQLGEDSLYGALEARLRGCAVARLRGCAVAEWKANSI